MRWRGGRLGFVLLLGMGAHAPTADAADAPATCELARVSWMGQGYPKLDLVKAKTYFGRVNAELEELIRDTIRDWDAAGL